MFVSGWTSQLHSFRCCCSLLIARVQLHFYILCGVFVPYNSCSFYYCDLHLFAKQTLLYSRHRSLFFAKASTEYRKITISWVVNCERFCEKSSMRYEWHPSREILTFRWPTVPEVGMVRVRWPILEFHTPWNIFGTAQARVVKFCVIVGYIKC